MKVSQNDQFICIYAEKSEILRGVGGISDNMCLWNAQTTK